MPYTAPLQHGNAALEVPIQLHVLELDQVVGSERDAVTRELGGPQATRARAGRRRGTTTWSRAARLTSTGERATALVTSVVLAFLAAILFLAAVAFVPAIDVPVAMVFMAAMGFIAA